MSNKKLIFGIGVNDVNYKVCRSEKGDGKQKLITICPYYSRWKGMFSRCYDIKYLTEYPSYVGCTVCDDWVYLSNFKSWMENQDWKDKVLDKDLLLEGNKVYSPNTCVFVDRLTNTFITGRGNDRGNYMIGVDYYKPYNKFRANCGNPIMKRQQFLGHFDTELEAHKAWQTKKHEHACVLAELQNDPRVAEALRQRYSPDKDWTKK